MGDISKKGKSKILLNKSNRPTLGTFKEFPIEIARTTYGTDSIIPDAPPESVPDSSDPDETISPDEEEE